MFKKTYSEVMKVTDFIFGMQGSFMRVVEHLEFKNQQRSDLASEPEIRGCSITQKI